MNATLNEAPAAEIATRPTVLILQPNPSSPSEQFLCAHAERLPARTIVIHGPVPAIDRVPLLPQGFVPRAWRRVQRFVQGRRWDAEVTRAYGVAIRRYRPAAALAEYGETGVDAVEACQTAGVPLIVHFHGYDASIRDVLRDMESRYKMMFAAASAIVVVSRAMKRKLISLGAPAEKVHHVTYGIDCNDFRGADPEHASPVFLAVGRFTEKKAPDLTLRAFAAMLPSCPTARLRMIGFGHLLEPCKELARSLQIADSVDFLGMCPPEAVQAEMRKARCFVQHSLEAPNGDCEGTPVAILEAGASGLPVISTRHAGIPDVVIESETGFLVDERDVAGMAEFMRRIALDGALAAKLGAAARTHIAAEFSSTKSIGKLWAVIASCIAKPVGSVD